MSELQFITVISIIFFGINFHGLRGKQNFQEKEIFLDTY